VHELFPLYKEHEDDVLESVSYAEFFLYPTSKKLNSIQNKTAIGTQDIYLHDSFTALPSGEA
jgi:hypothetical protein